LTGAHKVFIDTDIGNDIDDAYALAFALMHPQLDVVGISTVDHHVHLRAHLARMITKAVGKEHICVSAGAESSPTQTKVPQLTPQLAWAAGHSSEMPDCGIVAWDHLHRVAKENPGEVTLVCLGQLTNAAEAFCRYPSLKQDLKGLAIMGGEVVYFRREHNFANDYLAADKILRMGLQTFLATWSASKELILDRKTCTILKDQGGPVVDLLLELQSVWGSEPILYDLAPLLWVIKPDMFEVSARHLRVETTGLFTRGCVIDLEKYVAGLPIKECSLPGCSYERPSAVMVSQSMNVSRAKQVVCTTLLGGEGGRF
jgi:purine nucleosidase